VKWEGEDRERKQEACTTAKLKNKGKGLWWDRGNSSKDSEGANGQKKPEVVNDRGKERGIKLC